VREKMHTKLELENLEGGDHLEDLGVDGKIILNWIFKKQEVRVWVQLAQDEVQ
jgi:hypothetical protein